MRSFDEIYAIAADRKGGAEALETRLSVPLSSDELAATHDDFVDRLLSDKRIVRNGAKVMAIIENARFIQEIKAEAGSASAFLQVGQTRNMLIFWRP